MQDFKAEFLLDPDIHFLNHGSFGATPKAVFDVYQQWQRTLENQPVEMLDNRFKERMRVARSVLGDYIGSAPEDVVYFPNPTTAANMVARSLSFNQGDEILGTNHEYGAMDRLWRFVAKKTGAKYIRLPIPLPVTNPADFIEQFWSGVTARTRIIFLSHITSGTALTFPIAPIIQRARERGILTFIDGAHVPGQLPLNMQALDVDFYTGACHKWLCAPKGTAFMYAHKRVQDLLAPLVVSWGYEAEVPGDSQFVDYNELQGTKDISAYLSVPAAIQFQQDNDWDAVRAWAHQTVKQARREVLALTGTEAICPEEAGWFQSMAAIQLPELDCKALKARFWDDYRIEIPVYRWNDLPFLRISIQAYNEPADVEALLSALRVLIPELTAKAHPHAHR
jgi:isopenicillin-N epimerase